MIKEYLTEMVVDMLMNGADNSDVNLFLYYPKDSELTKWLSNFGFHVKLEQDLFDHKIFKFVRGDVEFYIRIDINETSHGGVEAGGIKVVEPKVKEIHYFE